MTNIQAAAIITLSLTAATSILFFDKRDKEHKHHFSIIAWMMFSWLVGLAIAVVFKLYESAVWGLIFGLALHTGSLILAGGNISKLQPNLKKRMQNDDTTY